MKDQIKKGQVLYRVVFAHQDLPKNASDITEVIVKKVRKYDFVTEDDDVYSHYKTGFIKEWPMSYGGLLDDVRAFETIELAQEAIREYLG